MAALYPTFTFILAVLKLMHLIDASWWVVFAPMEFFTVCFLYVKWAEQK
jgi:hypothetical protein